ncbi:transposase-like protein [Priestia megaterium]
MITVDNNPAYSIAIQELKEQKKMSKGIQVGQIRYLNNIIEQDYRFIKKCLWTMLGLKSFFYTAKAIISGVEALHMIKKKQVYHKVKSVRNQVRLIYQLFGIVS